MLHSKYVISAVLLLFSLVIPSTLSYYKAVSLSLPTQLSFLPEQSQDYSGSFYERLYNLKKSLYSYPYRKSENSASLISSRVMDASTRYEVPEKLIIAIMATESSFNQESRSYAGAHGLMQIVPSHWKGEMERFNYDISLPEDNTYLGAYILLTYKNRCGNWKCAAAAYNIGITAYLNNRKLLSARKYLLAIEEHFLRF